MSDRSRSAGSTDLPHHLLAIGAPVAVTRTSFGVTATVTGSCGAALLTATLWAQPPAEDDPKAQLVLVAGVVDMYTAPLLEAALNDAVDGHPTVRCDLSDVHLLTAAGIRALINAYERAARTRSRLTVCGAHGLTRHVLQITNVEHLLCQP